MMKLAKLPLLLLVGTVLTACDGLTPSTGAPGTVIAVGTELWIGHGPRQPRATEDAHGDTFGQQHPSADAEAGSSNHHYTVCSLNSANASSTSGYTAHSWETCRQDGHE